VRGFTTQIPQLLQRLFTCANHVIHQLHQPHLDAGQSGHRVIRYSSGANNTRPALEVLDANPAATNEVLLVYSGSNVLAATFPDGWNREHLWPNSYGLDDVEPAYSDLHNLRPCDPGVNSARGNKHYDTSDPTSPGYNPVAHPRAPLCSTDTDSWEPRPTDRGDLARALFYMATRYRGTASNEPALFLTDETHLIFSTTNLMGRLSTLLQWHAADPPDAAEQLRNDRVYSLYQTNRNPYVDHPEWVNLTFAPAHTNPPVLNISLLAQGFALTWLATNQVTQLEYATNVTGAWFNVTNTPILTNSQWLVVWTNAAPTALFRLHLP